MHSIVIREQNFAEPDKSDVHIQIPDHFKVFGCRQSERYASSMQLQGNCFPHTGMNSFLETSYDDVFCHFLSTFSDRCESDAHVK